MFFVGVFITLVGVIPICANYWRLVRIRHFWGGEYCENHDINRAVGDCDFNLNNFSLQFLC